MYMPCSAWHQHRAIGSWDTPEIGPRAYAALVGPSHFVASIVSHSTVLGRVHKATSHLASNLFGNPMDPQRRGSDAPPPGNLSVFVNKHSDLGGDMIGLCGHGIHVHLSDHPSVDRYINERSCIACVTLSCVATMR